MIQQKIYIAADAVVFNRNGGALQVLMIRRKNDPYKGRWAFPGGFVEDDEDLEVAARRELQEETGLKLPAMQQLRTYGRPDRDPRFRCISVVHYAIVDEAHEVAGADDAAEARWVAVDGIGPLAFDHNEILDFALAQLAGELR
jgi:8-oxo-dGTP diphosphatase